MEWDALQEPQVPLRHMLPLGPRSDSQTTQSTVMQAALAPRTFNFPADLLSGLISGYMILHNYTYTGCWFGTCFCYFSIQLGRIIPTDYVFFRGVETTNQYIWFSRQRVCVCFFFVFVCVCFVFVCVFVCVYPPAPMVVLNMFLPCCLRDELRCSHQQSIEVTAGSSTHLQVRILTLEFDPSFVVCEGPLTARNRPDPFLSEESTYLVNGKGTPGYPTVQKGTLQIPWPHYNAKKIPQSQ